MFESIDSFTRDSVPCATPDDVAETLRYVGSDKFTAFLDAMERTDIARYSTWLAMNAADPILDIIGDLAARRVYDRPAIMWG